MDLVKVKQEVFGLGKDNEPQDFEAKGEAVAIGEESDKR